MGIHKKFYLIRFFQKLAIPFYEQECWEWTGALNSDGYGAFWHGRNVNSHVLAYEIFKGTIPRDMHVLHGCDNRRCCNPEHLRLGTHAENMKDKVVRGRSWRGGSIRKAQHIIPVEVTRANL